MPWSKEKKLAYGRSPNGLEAKYQWYRTPRGKVAKAAQQRRYRTKKKAARITDGTYRPPGRPHIVTTDERI